MRAHSGLCNRITLCEIGEKDKKDKQLFMNNSLHGVLVRIIKQMTGERIGFR